MTGRRTIVGLCMLCALAFSAIAAQSASAVGTTQYTCVAGASGGKGIQFSDADCENEGGSKAFGHVAVGEESTTIKAAPQTAQTFESTLAGTVFSLSTSELEVTSGTCKNVKVGEEHTVHCTNVVLTYSNVVVLPAGINCTVDGVNGLGGAGMISTEPLTGTTAGQGDQLRLQPEGATPIAVFKFTGAACPLNGQEVKVVGSIPLTTKGSTLIATHATVTTDGKLRLGSAAGPKAGYSGTSTITAGKEGETHKPLSLTTT